MAVLCPEKLKLLAAPLYNLALGELRPTRLELWCLPIMAASWNPTTMNTRDEFRTVSVTEAEAARNADLNWKL